MKYVLHNGMKNVWIEADAVGLVLDDGTEIELQYRKSDGEVSLSVDHGQILIEPRAANVVRISVRK